MSDTVWAMQRAERERLVGYLATVPPAAWEQPSLCPEYRVRDVVGHLISGAKNTPPKFLLGMLKAKFDFDVAMCAAAARESSGTPADLTARLGALADARARPGPAMLGEVIVHSEDIRRAVGGGPGAYPQDHLRTVADAFRGAGMGLGAKKRIAGLRLEATDADWSTGEGPLVRGPLLSLVLAMTGRSVALADLDGPGVAELGRRS
ncbi:MAG: maleylpyruvate isomerase family mycothiol-dependent enzyme [Geodermatophilaceae bacterium]